MVTTAGSEMGEDEDDRDDGTVTAWRKVGTGGEQIGNPRICCWSIYIDMACLYK